MFIQWTKTGSAVSGSVEQATLTQPGSPPSAQSSSVTGTLNGNGLTLTVNPPLDGATSLVGTVIGGGFNLTVPGAANGSLITVSFGPAQVTDYDQAVSDLTTSQYASPCVLYSQGHDTQLSIIGPNAASSCASFVQGAGSDQMWTTAAPPVAAPDLSVVCRLSRRAENVTVLDDGGQTYGQEACSELEGEGWASG